MKGISGALFVILVSALGIAAQSSLTTIISELPSCALTCLGSAIANSTCAPTNQTCLCTNAPLQSEVTACVTASCTIKEALTTKNLTSTSCDAPVRGKGYVYSTLSTVMGSVTGAVVVLRFASKYATGSTFWFDDYFIATALLSGIPSSVLSVHGLASNGLGRDIWTLTFEQITSFFHVFYVMEILYFSHVALLKLSLLFFYLRVFPGTILRRLIWGTVAFDAVYYAVFVFIGIFQCQPIRYYWKQWDGEHQGKCINLNALGWANAAISIAIDIWMIGLPMSQVIKLNLHWKKKVGVGLMFGVGTFVTVVSILRLQSLAQFANTTNPTWDYFDVTKWSVIEINTGIICTCMPSLRVLLVYLFPKILGTTQRTNTGYYMQNSGSRPGGNASTNRSHHISLNRPPDKSDTMHSQTYAVDRVKTWDHDETHLVLDDIDSVSLHSIDPARDTSGKAPSAK